MALTRDTLDQPDPAPLSAFGAALLSWRGVAVALALGAAASLVFGLDPNLDLAVGRLFYVGNQHFVGQAGWGEALRGLFYWVPLSVSVLMLGLFLARRAGWGVAWAPSGQGLAFLALSLALGPGLLVNVVLKDHSHRPRPAQVTAFGGTMAYRPFYSFDGACARNCSFVSGEGASGFWTVAPALLAPASVQPAALVAALAFGTATALLRMAFGGHFLSDTIFAALFTWLVIAAAWRILFGRP